MGMKLTLAFYNWYVYCVVVTDLIERTELLHKQGGISNILTGKNCANSKIICNEIMSYMFDDQWY